MESNQDKYHLISLLEIMSQLSEEEIKRLKDLSYKKVEEKYNLKLLEKNDEMREE